MEIIGGGRVCIDDRVFCVVGSTEIERAVKPEKKAGVDSVRKTGGRKKEVIDTSAFVPGQGIGDRLEREQRLNSSATNDRTGAVRSVVGWKTKEFGHHGDIGAGDEIQFVSAKGEVGIRQAVDAVVLQIRVAGGRVKSGARRVAQA